MILIYITTGLLITYSILILFYRKGWKETKIYDEKDPDPTTKISVIIPARNEEENIGRLLRSIQNQTYPSHLFEVILVDDHSEDNTAAIAGTFSFVKIIQLQFDQINSYKKKAIEAGIGAASGDLIVTTDADCEVPPDWLKVIAAFKEENNAAFIAAPVMLTGKHGFLQLFQALDFMVLQGITAASAQKKIHNMCNGANLAYERKVFYEVNGFSEIDHIASGDDMLLMQKIYKHFPNRVFYLLSEKTIVETNAAENWKEFFNQRIRWASKATHYNDIKIFSILFLVYFFNFSLFMLVIAGFWNAYLWIALGFFILAKTIIELSFLYPVALFYSRQSLLKWFVFFQPFHIVYTVIAGWLGSFGNFEWKGRRVK